jgi:hypothetical protein
MDAAASARHLESKANDSGGRIAQMAYVPAGGGGPVWTGSIQVCPGNLEASAPAFTAAGNQVAQSWASVFPWQDAGGAGITDPVAGAAWSRLVMVWSADLNTLSDGLEGLSLQLYAAAGSYEATDDGVMDCRASG